MELYLWAVIGILLCLTGILSAKLFLMRKAAEEIETEFTRRLVGDTNILIDISSRDPLMRKLAASINVQLRSLRKERQRFLQGDLELKEAVTNISHDLRTPLTAVCGYLELLEREDTSENIKRYLAQIENRTEELKRLTEELFRYSIVTSTQEADKKAVDLHRLLEESLLSFYGVMRQKGITPEISIPETTVERLLDPTAVSRIFSNIISNALKYSSGDLKVTMDAKGTIVFANTAEDMNAVTAGKLFDRFYTVENGRNSTGLGLSIAKLLTERMGGTVHSKYHDSKLFIILSFPE